MFCFVSFLSFFFFCVFFYTIHQLYVPPYLFTLYLFLLERNVNITLPIAIVRSERSYIYIQPTVTLKRTTSIVNCNSSMHDRLLLLFFFCCFVLIAWYQRLSVSLHLPSPSAAYCSSVTSVIIRFPSGKSKTTLLVPPSAQRERNFSVNVE